MFGKKLFAVSVIVALSGAASGQELRGNTYSFMYADQPGRIFIAKSGNAYYSYAAFGTGIEFKANKTFQASIKGCSYRTFAAHGGNSVALDWTTDCPDLGVRTQARVVLLSDGVTCSVRMSIRASTREYPNTSSGGTSDSCSILPGNHL